MSSFSELAKEAVQIADSLPEKYQEVAFIEIFRAKLSANPPFASPDEEKRENAGASYPESHAAQTQTRLPAAHLIKERGDRKQQAVWAVVTLQERGEDATSDAIRSTIRQQLGITPQNATNTGRTLRQITPRYIKRESKNNGHGYVYYPQEEAFEIFEELHL